MSQETNIQKLDANMVTIENAELAHLYIKGDLDPIIIHRDGRNFNLKITISVSDVSDETPESKPTGAWIKRTLKLFL